MTDVTLIRSGRWGLSRALFVDGGWTTYAAEQRLAPTVENHWPPIRAGAPVVNAVLVRLVGPVTAPADTNTRLFPRDLADLADVTLGELTAAQGNNLRNFLESWLLGYSFQDWDGQQKVIAAFTEKTATYTNSTTLKQIVRDIYKHLYHSANRPRPVVTESHNTEYTDDFATDTASRWTNFTSFTGVAWNSTNQEADVGGDNDCASRYSANNPGSIEHEAQALTLSYTDRRAVGPGVRMYGTNRDAYGCSLDQSDNLQLWKLVGATRTNIAVTTLAITQGNWIWQRLAAEGTAGNNVVLSYWRVDTGSATKPGADAGWQGANGTPDYTFTDTAADRLDDSTHTDCGLAGRGAVSATSRTDWWRERAISDRAGGPTLITASDTLAPGVTDAASIAVVISASDTLAPGITDAVSAIAASLAVNDTLAPGVTDALSSIAATLAVSDTVTVQVVDASALLAALSASDSLAPGVTDAATVTILASTLGKMLAIIAVKPALAGDASAAAALGAAPDVKPSLGGKPTLH